MQRELTATKDEFSVTKSKLEKKGLGGDLSEIRQLREEIDRLKASLGN